MRPRRPLPRDPARVLLALACLLGGCGRAANFDENTCGNGVIDEDRGEECDDRRAGCGQPGDGPRACRFTCTPPAAATTTCTDDAGAPPESEAASEPHGDCLKPGYRCGLDGICRRAAGAFETPVTLGRVGDLLQIVDYDGDRYPDLALRGANTLSIYSNTPAVSNATCPAGTTCLTGQNRFQLVASGGTHRADGVSVAGIALVARPSSLPGDSFIAAVESDGLALYNYRQDDTAFTPLLVPSIPLPADPKITLPVLVGSVTWPGLARPLPLLSDDADAADLAVFDFEHGTWGAHIDLMTQCGFPGWKSMGMPNEATPLRVEVGKGPGGRSLLAIVWQPTMQMMGMMGGTPAACAALAGPNGFDVFRLPLPAAPQGAMQVLGAPLIGDFTGDGLADIAIGLGDQAQDRMLVYSGAALNGPMQPSFALYNSVLGNLRWTLTPGGGMAPMQSAPSMRAADLDGDGWADLVATTSYMPGMSTPYPAVLRNPWRGGVRDAPWTIWKMPFSTDLTLADAADVTGDGLADWIGIRPGTGQIITCIGDGDGAFGCGETNTPLSKISNGEIGAGRGAAAPPLFADVNGDRVTDIVIAEPGGANRTLECVPGQNPGRLSALFGRPFGIPTDVRTVAAYRALLRAFAPTRLAGDEANVHRIATDVIVQVETQPPRNEGSDSLRALTTLRIDPSGTVATGFSGRYRIVEWRDADGDAVPDLVTLTRYESSSAFEYWSGDPKTHLFRNTKASFTLPPAVRDLTDVGLFAAGDMRPAVLAWQAHTPQKSGRVVISRWNPATPAYEAVWDNYLDCFLARAVDLDSDGVDEVVIFADGTKDAGAGGTTPVTDVYVLHFRASDAPPYWIAASQLDGNPHTVALADVPDTRAGEGHPAHPDGALSVVSFGATPGVWHAKGFGQFEPARTDAKFPVLEEALRLGPADMDVPQDAWVTTKDLNGDRVADVVLQGRRGLIILLGTVVKP